MLSSFLLQCLKKPGFYKYTRKPMNYRSMKDSGEVKNTLPSHGTHWK